ncbi:hypothetical protein T11_5696 [Trichinella zimbabwensis]|uniref:Uncharacterized protein n=1 Tax=Trichinella zimbabwensis TaxID=268475 RepID=A0A0V1HF43_9BILA|nr:hypothetical protein T11_5696 [Trichinella zimbabwensis]
MSVAVTYNGRNQSLIELEEEIAPELERKIFHARCAPVGGTTYLTELIPHFLEAVVQNDIPDEFIEISTKQEQYFFTVMTAKTTFQQWCRRYMLTLLRLHGCVLHTLHDLDDSVVGKICQAVLAVSLDLLIIGKLEYLDDREKFLLVDAWHDSNRIVIFSDHQIAPHCA